MNQYILRAYAAIAGLMILAKILGLTQFDWMWVLMPFWAILSIASINWAIMVLVAWWAIFLKMIRNGKQD